MPSTRDRPIPHATRWCSKRSIPKDGVFECPFLSRQRTRNGCKNNRHTRVLFESLKLRVNYRERRGSKQMIVDRFKNRTQYWLLLGKGPLACRHFRQREHPPAYRGPRHAIPVSVPSPRVSGRLETSAALHRPVLCLRPTMDSPWAFSALVHLSPAAHGGAPIA